MTQFGPGREWVQIAPLCAVVGAAAGLVAGVAAGLTQVIVVSSAAMLASGATMVRRARHQRPAQGAPTAGVPDATTLAAPRTLAVVPDVETPIEAAESLFQPAAAATRQPTEPTRVPPAAIFAMQILLVLPKRNTATRLVRILREARADVVILHQGRDAISATLNARDGTEPPLDAIIVSMHLPDAIETVVCLRDDGFRGPILGLTTESGEPSHERCLAAGCSDLITDAVTGDALIETLHRLVQVHFAS